MDLRSCRFCSEVVPSKHSVGLFTNQAEFTNLAVRFSILLQVPVASTDGLLRYCCRQCKESFLNLERKLESTRNRVKAVYQSAGIVTSLAVVQPSKVGSLKRTKDTSGGPGVSPATEKARPPHKRSAVSRTLFPQGIRITSRKLCHMQQILIIILTLSQKPVKMLTLVLLQ